MPLTGLEQPGPFRVNVYDKDFNFQFRLGDSAVSVTPRHLAKSTGTLTVPLAHDRADYLLHRGVRCTIDYLIGSIPSDEDSWARVVSGPLWTVQIPDDGKPTAGKIVAFGVEGDERVLWQILAWPNPGDPISDQSASAYWTQSGACETVVKALVTANADRLGLPLTCAANAARGATVKANLRFDVIGDAVASLCQQGGLGFTVTQVDDGLVFDVYEPTDRTARVLSEASGTILSWSLTRTGPSATRVIVAAQGAGTARDFREVLDTSGLETAWGTVVETFVDARDTDDSATLTQRGKQALADGQQQAGFAVTVAETDVVKAYRNLFVGDLVAVQITPTLAESNVLTQMTLTWGDNGLTVQPQVGSADATANPNALFARAISTLARKVRYLGSSQ